MEYQSRTNLVPIWYQSGTNLVPIWYQSGTNLVVELVVVEVVALGRTIQGSILKLEAVQGPQEPLQGSILKLEPVQGPQEPLEGSILKP